MVLLILICLSFKKSKSRSFPYISDYTCKFIKELLNFSFITLNSATAYYLFLIYFASICKPVTPLIFDVLAHIFSKHEHIMSVHHEHGKNHLDYEMAKTSNDAGTNNKSAVFKLYDETHSFFPVQYCFPLYTVFIDKNQYGLEITDLTDIILTVQLPPPKTCGQIFYYS